MMMYLLNFVLCSGLLLIVYYLFLQNERMYRFNRFYLLFSLIFSLGVSFITITTTTKILPVPNQQNIQQVAEYQNVDSGVSAPSQAVAEAPAVEPVNYLPMILMGFYSLVALVLLTRFVVNLYRISREINENQVVDYQQTQLILTNADVTPHSFLNYIFVNRDDYADGIISPEIILHEQTHVRQLHSLDVMLVELFQAIFWFNPFIPFYRKAIQLNHEFLADEAVIEKYDNTTDYQYLLLAKASQVQGLQLTSQFNYQTTKKRLIMMTKTTSAKMAWGKKLLLVPVIAGAVLLFSQKTEAQVPGQPSPPPEPPIVEKRMNSAKPLPPPMQQPPKQDPPKLGEKPKPKVDVVRFPPPVPKLREEYRVKFAATDAPKAVLDDYAALLKKYDMPNRFPWRDITVADKAQMEALYVQMSKKQQDDQYVGFAKALKPLPKNKVTVDQLLKWQNKDYFVRIDGSNKRVKPEDLAKYNPEDFDRMRVGPAGEWAYKHNNGTQYFVDLMTKPYYAERYRLAMEDRSDIIVQLKPVEKARQ